MTAAALTPSIEYLGDGTTIRFAAPFRFLADSLVVDLIAADGTVTRQLAGTNYSVIGGATDGGGTVTMNVAPAGGVRVRIRRATARAQTSDYDTNDTLPADTLENDFDRAMLVDQEQDVAIADLVARALVVPDGEHVAALPGALARADRLLGFGAAPGAGVVASSFTMTQLASVIAGIYSPGNTTLADLVSFLQAGAGAVPRTVQAELRDVHTVKQFGAAGDRITDDTAAFATALGDTASLAVEVPYAIYAVTHVDLDLLGRTFDGRGAVLEGHATAATTSVVGLRGGLSWYRDMRISANFNLNYQCGLHWYTNRLDLADRDYPGFVDVVNLQTEAAEIGLMIGALPSQATIGTQSDVYPTGQAIDAPLSESVISNFKATNCVIGCFMRQPNGKVTLIGPRLHAEPGLWVSQHSYATPSKATAVSIAHDGSELSVFGGTVENVQRSEGTLISMTGGRLNVIGSAIETVVPSFVDGHSYLYLDHIQNFGLNFATRAFLEIGPTFDGTISISNCRVVRPAGNAATGGGELAKSVAALGGSFAPKLQTVVNLHNVELRDTPWRMGGATYQPIVRGVRVRFSQCQLTTYDTATPPNRTSLLRLDDGPDLLAGVADRTYKTIAAYPQTTNPTTGGITFTPTGAGSQWGTETAGLPSIEDMPVYAWLRLTGGGSGGTMSAQWAKARCKPGKAHIVRGFIKTGASGATLILRAKYFDYGGAAASRASDDLFIGPEAQFGSTIQPLIFYFVPPADADQFALYVEAQNGADCRLTLLEIG